VSRCNSPPIQPQANSDSLSIFIHWCLPESSYDWSHTLCSLLCLALSTQHTVSELRAHWDTSSFILWSRYTTFCVSTHQLINFWIALWFYLFILVVLGIELRALCLLGRCSIPWVTLPLLFCFTQFLVRVSYLLPRVNHGLDYYPPT
jgi:hypothetical protein